jgi:hypothetical protein
VAPGFRWHAEGLAPSAQPGRPVFDQAVTVGVVEEIDRLLQVQPAFRMNAVSPRRAGIPRRISKRGWHRSVVVTTWWQLWKIFPGCPEPPRNSSWAQWQTALSRAPGLTGSVPRPAVAGPPSSLPPSTPVAGGVTAVTPSRAQFRRTSPLHQPRAKPVEFRSGLIIPFKRSR